MEKVQITLKFTWPPVLSRHWQNGYSAAHVQFFVRRAIGVVMVIWKFELEVTDMQELTMPDCAELLSVANQNGNLCLWAMVDPAKEKRHRYIEIIGTGNPMPTDMGVDRKFIGTVVVNPFVWHVFERR